MRAFRELTWKCLVEAQWTLLASMIALFSLGWLGVYQTLRVERRIRDAVLRGDFSLLGRISRGFGGVTLDYSSASIEMNGWNLPFVLLPVIAWSVGRGSQAVAGELERGTMDLVLSRPIARSTYLLAQVSAATVGLLGLGLAILLGHLVGVRYNRLEAPPALSQVIRPALNLSALGFAIFGLTLIPSAVDRIRWRPTLAGSCLTLISYATLIVVNQPGMEDFKRLERGSIFKAFNPVEVATTGLTFVPNVVTLLAVGALGVGLATWLFGRRDLPAGS